MALGGIEVHELAMLPKLELRVDTTCHNLQLIGEILASLEFLKLNDSIIRNFMDIGTSFKNVRVLHIARCELKEVYGIRSFEQLEELYISYNQIDDLFDISFLEHVHTLDYEGNICDSPDQLDYLKRMEKLKDLNMKYNPVTRNHDYYPKIEQKAPNLQVLDDEIIGDDRAGFFNSKQKKLQEKYDVDGKPLQEDLTTQDLYQGSLVDVLTKFSMMIGF